MARVLDPGPIEFELEAGLARDEMSGQMQREAEGDERREQRDPVGQFPRSGSSATRMAPASGTSRMRVRID